MRFAVTFAGAIHSIWRQQTIVVEALLICATSLAVVVIVNRYLICAIYRAITKQRRKTIVMAIVVAAALWAVTLGLSLGSLAGAWMLVYTRPGFQQFPVLIQLSMFATLATGAIWAAEAGARAGLGGTSTPNACASRASHLPLPTKAIVGYFCVLGVLVPFSYLVITNADAIAEWGRQNLTTLLGSDVTAITVTLAVVLPPAFVLALGMAGLGRLCSAFFDWMRPHIAKTFRRREI